ncbi:hypothetical protein [Flavobacterium sp.]|uniref:hypothetical protein n=1 Tax=Flavobacterium sp. TaxID=239 RepID=UPI003D6AA918
MRNFNWINTFSFSTLIAIFSFLIGTVLFLLFIIIPSQNLLIIGFLYVATAVFINLIILISLIGQLLFIPLERTENTIRILILLSNIPIAILYLSHIIY